MAVNDRKHTILGSTDTPSRALFNAMLASVNDIVPVANTTERATVATAIAPTTTRPLVVYRADAAPGYELEITENGTTWWTIPSTPNAYGKMWKTGTQAISGSLTTVTMDASRVSGGVTFDNATDSLTLPLDGMWEVIIRGSVSGASGALGYFACKRVRTAVADIRWVTVHFDKPDALDRAVAVPDVVPLKAGDKLSMEVVGAVVGSARGSTEYDGCVLTATWRGPLNGATPI